MIPGLIALTRAPRLPPPHCFDHQTEGICAPGDLVGAQRICHLIRAEHNAALPSAHAPCQRFGTGQSALPPRAVPQSSRSQKKKTLGLHEGSGYI